MSKLVILYVCILTCICMVGCSQDPVAGKVIDKHYHPPWIQNVPVMVNKIMVPSMIPHPAQYYLVIKDTKEELHTRQVTDEFYYKTNVGDFVELPGS